MDSSNPRSLAVDTTVVSGDAEPKDVAVVKPKRKAKKKPPSVVLNLRDCRYRVLSVAVSKCGWGKSTSNPITSMLDWDVYWTDSGHGIEHIVHIAKSYQRINHFPGMNSIYRKHHLAKSIARMQRFSGNEYDFFPKTWLLPENVNDIKAYFKSEIGNTKDTFCIVKPAASCQVMMKTIAILFILR